MNRTRWRAVYMGSLEPVLVVIVSHLYLAL